MPNRTYRGVRLLGRLLRGEARVGVLLQPHIPWGPPGGPWGKAYLQTRGATAPRQGPSQMPRMGRADLNVTRGAPSGA